MRIKNYWRSKSIVLENIYKLKKMLLYKEIKKAKGN